VDLDVVRNAEPGAEPKDRRIVAKQVVQHHALRPPGLEEPEQGREVTRHAEAEVRERVVSAVIDKDGLPPAVDGGAQDDGAAPLRPQAGAMGGDGPLHPAPGVVRDQDDRASAGAACITPAQEVEFPACSGERVGRDEVGDELGVTGVQSVQDGGVARHEMRPRRAERAATRMRDESPRGGDVLPAEVLCAQAKVVFLAIALREHVLAQQPDRVQAIAPDVHAEPDRSRDIDNHAGIWRRARASPGGRSPRDSALGSCPRYRGSSEWRHRWIAG
jgi:hypothetical protein